MGITTIFDSAIITEKMTSALYHEINGIMKLMTSYYYLTRLGMGLVRLFPLLLLKIDQVVSTISFINQLLSVSRYLGSGWHSALGITNTLFYIRLLLLLFEILLGCWHFEFLKNLLSI